MKYKINYKAQDSVEIDPEEVADRINRFLDKEHGDNIDEVEVDDFGGYFYYKVFLRDGNWFHYRVYYDTKCVDKLHKGENVKMTNAELQFFDNLGYELEALQSRDTGQQIEDWF